MDDTLNKINTVSLDKHVDNDTFAQDMDKLRKQDNLSTESPGERGSESISGSESDVESDDDVLQNAHHMGIAPNADLEHPKPLNIARDINNAEEHIRTH